MHKKNWDKIRWEIERLEHQGWMSLGRMKEWISNNVSNSSEIVVYHKRKINHGQE